jgi:hypothetical protein
VRTNAPSSDKLGGAVKPSRSVESAMSRGHCDRGSVQTRARRRVSTEENETVLVRSQELRRAKSGP